MARADDKGYLSDEENIILNDTFFTSDDNKPQQLKKIILAVSLVIFGILGFILGIYMSCNRIGGDISHGIFFAIIGAMFFLPGFYHTRIAYYAYKGYRGFSFSHIPAV